MNFNRFRALQEAVTQEKLWANERLIQAQRMARSLDPEEGHLGEIREA